MISQIEDALVTRITTKLATTAGMVAVQKGFEGITQPAVYVSTEEGKFERESNSTYRHHLTIFVDIIFEHLGDEAERRKGIYLILEGVLQTILLQDLGLKIKPLVPKSWRNATTEDIREHGLLAFTLEVETAFSVTNQSDEVVTDLLTVGMSYFLLPGDAIADASDTVSLPLQPKV